MNKKILALLLFLGYVSLNSFYYFFGSYLILSILKINFSIKDICFLGIGIYLLKNAKCASQFLDSIIHELSPKKNDRSNSDEIHN